MIRHIVMWKLKGPSAEEKRAQAEQARAALLGMRGQVPGMSQIEVGIGSVSGEQEADLVLSSTHDSWQALSDYQDHPAHTPVKKLIGELRTERRVVDFEV
ncbi:MAG TPA: Dabb family protein [Polyangiaceae bacterium]|nr:Dabb family protein [Polyangiaceae bacterium]